MGRSLENVLTQSPSHDCNAIRLQVGNNIVELAAWSDGREASGCIICSARQFTSCDQDAVLDTGMAGIRIMAATLHSKLHSGKLVQYADDSCYLLCSCRQNQAGGIQIMKGRRPVASPLRVIGQSSRVRDPPRQRGSDIAASLERCGCWRRVHDGDGEELRQKRQSNRVLHLGL